MFSRAAVQVINGSHIKSALNSAQVQTYWYLNHLCPGNDAGGMVRLSQTLVTLMPKSPATPGVLFSVARGEMVALSHSLGVILWEHIFTLFGFYSWLFLAISGN